MCVWVVWCLQRVYSGVACVPLFTVGDVYMSGTQPGSSILLGGSKVITSQSQFHTLWNPIVASHVHGWSPRILSFYCAVLSEHTQNHFLHLLILGLLLDIVFVIFSDNFFPILPFPLV